MKNLAFRMDNFGVGDEHGSVDQTPRGIMNHAEGYHGQIILPKGPPAGCVFDCAIILDPSHHAQKMPPKTLKGCLRTIKAPRQGYMQNFQQMKNLAPDGVTYG